MTHQLIRISALLAFSTFASARALAGICYLDDGATHPDCETLEKADKELNNSYKYLVERISKNDLIFLKKSQRDWIKWRDESCEASVEQSGCKELSCESRNYNSCMSALTKARNSELVNFKNDLPKAVLMKFSFQTTK